MSEKDTETNTEKQSPSSRKPRKKRVRGFGGVILRQLDPLNSNEYFKKEFKEESFKLLLNAKDGKFAALIKVDKGTIEVESVPNTPKESLKKKVLGWNGKLETTTEIFLNVAMGKIGKGGMIKKVLSRKIKIRGPKSLFKLLKMFSILSHEEEKAKPKESNS